MKLNFNDQALRHLAATRPPDKEGRLLYRNEVMSRGKYKQRLFRLHANLLFYYKTTETGAPASPDPVGLLVLAGHTAAYEEDYADRPFVFSLSFAGDDSKHYFSGATQESCLGWVDALTAADQTELGATLNSLRRRIENLTGRDPLATAGVGGPHRPARREVRSRPTTGTPGGLNLEGSATAGVGGAKFYVPPPSARESPARASPAREIAIKGRRVKEFPARASPARDALVRESLGRNSPGRDFPDGNAGAGTRNSAVWGFQDSKEFGTTTGEDWPPGPTAAVLRPVGNSRQNVATAAEMVKQGWVGETFPPGNGIPSVFVEAGAELSESAAVPSHWETFN